MDWNSVDGCIKSFAGAGEVATFNCVPALLKNIVTAGFMFAGTVALIMIIIAGYKFVTSGGDPKQAASARQTMTYAVIGLIIILLSFFIMSVISYITGVQCLNVGLGGWSFNKCATTGT